MSGWDYIPTAPGARLDAFGKKILSPKMQRTIRVNEQHLTLLSEKAQYDHSLSGYLHKRGENSNKWQLRWFVLYQNLLFYYETENNHRPSGVLMLEGSYCDQLITPDVPAKTKEGVCEKQFCFAISYRRENIRQYELKALNEMDCQNWIEAIQEASFNKLLLTKEEIEQKHLHLLHIVESEKQAKWQYTQQCEDMLLEINKLRGEVNTMRKDWRPIAQSDAEGATASLNVPFNFEQESAELRKIKKVQSFFRGWLCRRRWKNIVEQYIKSPHAESMRKRNSLVFRMVEAEEEYMEQMEVLVACFFRPFKMAASSKKPPCSHEDVNSIFLNSETVLFLHQIFLKGLTSRLENWPTLVIGDLFTMLLPMLSIYQEYVRNHHYSLQVLTECKQAAPFANLLKRLESKPACQGRSLETFLTYPMHQIPRYIITLHELLAHTPYDHVERKTLLSARQQLEDLSRLMHDEVSETENLRKNLAVERMVVEGCDILLDVNQVFVRQGSLVQILSASKSKKSKWPVSSGKGEKEALRQCFLFSNHLIIATRTSSGKLHLVPDIGKIPLADALLIEDPSENPEDDEASLYSCLTTASGRSGDSGAYSAKNLHNRDFKIIVDVKVNNQVKQYFVHFLAPSLQEKIAWVTDISQCLDNVTFNDMMRPSLSHNSSITLPQSLKNDPKLFKDEADIRFSRTMNSCKVPQIRYATPERLLQRLTDLRFLSIDFLNTFLLTYRVFTEGETVLEALKQVFYNASFDPERQDSVISLDIFKDRDDNFLHLLDERRRSSISPRRTSGASSVSGYCSEISERDRSHSYDSQGQRYWKATLQKYDEEKECVETPAETDPQTVSIQVEAEKSDSSENVSHLSIPKFVSSSSDDTLTGGLSAPCSPSNLSSITLVGSQHSDENENTEPSKQISYPDKPASVSSKQIPSPVVSLMRRAASPMKDLISVTMTSSSPVKEAVSLAIKALSSFQQAPATTKKTSPVTKPEPQPVVAPISSSNPLLEKPEIYQWPVNPEIVEQKVERRVSEDNDLPAAYVALHRASCTSTKSATSAILQSYYYGPRRSMHSEHTTARSSFQHDSPSKTSKAGVVVTSSRQSKRRSSTSTAAAAFAIATCGSSNPPDITKNPCVDPAIEEEAEKTRFKESIISTACTMRVLNVLRHWITKHAQDFQCNQRLKDSTIQFLHEIMYSPGLVPLEQKAAGQLIKILTKSEDEIEKNDISKILEPPVTPCMETIESLSALEIAEQMTYIDHQIFVSILSEEFLGQAWMKNDKSSRAPNILLMTKRFNDVSRLVASEIVRRSRLEERIAAIEKWAAVADISRCLHNFNGVLQICSAFTNTSVFRLKKTWDKVSRTTRETIEKCQNIVSSDGRFRALRDALHRCDPPCIPYLGIYLTDLSFIEEGTPNFTEDGLLNFAKMRMIAHVIREIRHFQQTSYKIEPIRKVSNYLLDSSLLMDDEELYSTSLTIEPRTSRLSSAGLTHQYSLSRS